MRVYKRDDFLKLPAGIIFSQGNKWCFQDISVKGETLTNDFMYMDFCTLEAQNSDMLFTQLEDSLENGTSYTINESYTRDGYFDDQDVFLVFEKDDISKMEGLLNESMTVRFKHGMD